MIRYLLAALLLAASAPACARVQLEVGAGISHAGIRANGTWYQQGFAHALQTSSPVAEIDLRWRIHRALDLITGIVDLGSYGVNSQDTPNDANYSGNAAHPCVGPCLPLANYVGSGHLWGVQALLERRWGDHWRIGLVGGLLAYRESWRMDVPNWYPSDPVGARVWYTPRAIVGAYQLGPVIPIHTSDQQWALGAVIGVTLSRRGSPWALSLRYVKDSAKFGGHNGGWPPLWKSHMVAMVSYRF